MVVSASCCARFNAFLDVVLIILVSFVGVQVLHACSVFAAILVFCGIFNVAVKLCALRGGSSRFVRQLSWLYCFHLGWCLSLLLQHPLSSQPSTNHLFVVVWTVFVVIAVKRLLEVLSKALFHVDGSPLQGRTAVGFGDEVSFYVGLLLGNLTCYWHESESFCLIAVLAVFSLSLRTKSLFSLLIFVSFLVYSAVVFPWLFSGAVFEPYAVLAIFSFLYLRPIVELLLLTDRNRLPVWVPLITARRSVLLLAVLAVVLLEGLFYLLLAVAVSFVYTPVVVVPLYVVASVFWFLMHYLFVHVILTLANRLTSDCMVKLATDDDLASGHRHLCKVLVVKGLRYFGLLAHVVMYAVLASTLLLFLLLWTAHSFGIAVAFFAVFTVEAMVEELIAQLSSNLGGSCIGCSVIMPVFPVRSDGLVSILPPNFVQSSAARSTKTLNTVLWFFADSTIVNYGCEWLFSSPTAASMKKKIGDFFSQVTTEGPRYDTYFLYFSGPVNEGGDWAFSDGLITLEDLLKVWDEQNGKGGSRLILLCDTHHSDQWLRPVNAIQRHIVGLQTYRQPASMDVSVGKFTEFWVRYNQDRSDSRQVALNELTVRPAFALSRAWGRFRRYRPSIEDARNYWLKNLPMCPRSFIDAVLFVSMYRCNCCERLLDSVHCWKWRFCLSRRVDSGHGFALIAS